MDSVEVFELWGVDAAHNFFEVVIVGAVNPEGLKICHGSGCGWPAVVVDESAIIYRQRLEGFVVVEEHPKLLCIDESRSSRCWPVADFT